MTKILITGAAGFIGRQVIDALSGKSDFEVLGIDLRSLDGQIAANVEFLLLDIRSKAVAELVQERQFDVVVHLACVVTPPQGMSRAEMFEIDVTATKRLLDACVAAGVKKFIITSSGAAYGYHADNPVPLKESDRLRGNKNFAYSDHKRQVEEMLMEYAKAQPGLTQLIFRPGAVIGKNVRNQITNLFEQRLLTALHGAESPFGFIWDADLVAYIVEGIKSEVQGVFNVTADGYLTIKQIARKIGKPCVQLPVRLVKTALSVLHPLGLIQYGPEQVEFMQFRPLLDNSRIKASFKHQPIYTSEQAFDAYWLSRQD